MEDTQSVSRQAIWKTAKEYGLPLISCNKGYFIAQTDEEMEDYVSYIKEKNTDVESQNECELEEEKMEQVKVLKEVTRIIYPNRMDEVIPIKEFVKNITDKGYKVMIKRENVISGKYDVVIYEEEELKE